MNLNILGVSEILNPTWDIHFENVSVKSGSVTAPTPTIDTDQTTVSYSVTLNTPGDYFEFTSTAPLSSPHAVFYGSCKIEADNDGVKDIRIPTFQMSVDEAYPRLIN